MSTSVTVRKALLRDMEAINSIYNHYVPISDCTMEVEPVSLEARQLWFHEHGANLPILVAEVDGQVVGWASLSKHRLRSAYRYTVEDAVYVHESMLGKGIGSSLLDELIVQAKCKGYHSIIAVINANQKASLDLHGKKGFIEVAHLREAGFKLGRWVDIKYMQLMIDQNR
jgi:L-amino acid N-acyltransferase YncA